MARKIIIQERIDEPSDLKFRVVFWVDVPVARQSYYADPSKTSAVKDVTGAELAAIRVGQIVERQQTALYLAGATVPMIRADLITKWTAFQAEITTTNPWRYYGTSWDGSTWTAGGAP